MLPLILLEMSEGAPAMLGALDACCLCAVCAGVCAAVHRADRAAAAKQHAGVEPLEALTKKRAPAADRRHGLSPEAINFWLGDYVEACYPYMERSAAVRAAAYLGAAAAGAVIVHGCPSALSADGRSGGPVRSSAYLPLPVAVVVSDEPRGMLLACALAIGVPYLGVRLAYAPGPRA